MSLKTEIAENLLAFLAFWLVRKWTQMKNWLQFPKKSYSRKKLLIETFKSEVKSVEGWICIWMSSWVKISSFLVSPNIIILMEEIAKFSIESSSQFTRRLPETLTKKLKHKVLKNNEFQHPENSLLVAVFGVQW